MTRHIVCAMAPSHEADNFSTRKATSALNSDQFYPKLLCKSMLTKKASLLGNEFFAAILALISVLWLLVGCSTKPKSDDEYLSKTAKAVIFFSTSSESLFRNLSIDPRKDADHSFDRYSQVLLNNFVDIRSSENFKTYVIKLNRTALNLIQDVANPPVKYVQLHKQVLAMYYEYKTFTGAINEARVQIGKEDILKSLDSAISTMFKIQTGRENLEPQFPTEIYKKAVELETKHHQDILETLKKFKKS